MHVMTSIVLFGALLASGFPARAMPTVQVKAAAHAATLKEGIQVWNSRYVFFAATESGQHAFLEFANPLPAGSGIESAAGVEMQAIVDADGQMTGFEFIPSQACLVSSSPKQRRRGLCEIGLVTRSTFAAPSTLLSPPLALSDAIQRLHIDAGNDFIFELDKHYGLTRYLTHHAATSVGDQQIREVERLLGEHLGLPEPGSIYLTTPVLTSGIRGHLLSLRQHRNLVAGLAGFGSLLTVILLIVVFRYTARITQREQKKHEMEQRFVQLHEELTKAQSAIDQLDP